MKKNLPYLVFVFCMLSALLLSILLTPTIEFKTKYTPVTLALMIPSNLPLWHMISIDNSSIVNPEVNATLSRTYDQTLTRVYVGPRNIRIMLSVAYGANQTKKDTLHFPEVCYTAQGFFIGQKLSTRDLPTAFGRLHIKQFVAEKPGRVENVSYWAMMGKKNATDPWHLKAEQVKYGLNGYLPDGLIFRISSLGIDSKEAFLMHSQFIENLLASMSAQDRQRLTGLGVN